MPKDGASCYVEFFKFVHDDHYHEPFNQANAGCLLQDPAKDPLFTTMPGDHLSFLSATYSLGTDQVLGIWMESSEELGDAGFVAGAGTAPNDDDFYSLYNPSASFGSERKNKFLLCRLVSSHDQARLILIVANAASTDVGVVAMSADGSWANWELNEGCGIVMPLDSEGNDMWPVAMSLDYTSTVWLDG
ncbi:hypothetical protein HDU91_000353, partial [Kappamyces sp. JEL0680]